MRTALKRLHISENTKKVDTERVRESFQFANNDNKAKTQSGPSQNDAIRIGLLCRCSRDLQRKRANNDASTLLNSSLCQSLNLGTLSLSLFVSLSLSLFLSVSLPTSKWYQCAQRRERRDGLGIARKQQRRRRCVLHLARRMQTQRVIKQTCDRLNGGAFKRSVLLS